VDRLGTVRTNSTSGNATQPSDGAVLPLAVITAFCSGARKGQLGALSSFGFLRPRDPKSLLAAGGTIYWSSSSKVLGSAPPPTRKGIVSAKNRKPGEISPTVFLWRYGFSKLVRVVRLTRWCNADAELITASRELHQQAADCDGHVGIVQYLLIGFRF
jgi:hypothetical protein